MFCSERSVLLRDTDTLRAPAGMHDWHASLPAPARGRSSMPLLGVGVVFNPQLHPSPLVPAPCPRAVPTPCCFLAPKSQPAPGTMGVSSHLPRTQAAACSAVRSCGNVPVGFQLPSTAACRAQHPHGRTGPSQWHGAGGCCLPGPGDPWGSGFRLSASSGRRLPTYRPESHCAPALPSQGHRGRPRIHRSTPLGSCSSPPPSSRQPLGRSAGVVSRGLVPACALPWPPAPCLLLGGCYSGLWLGGPLGGGLWDLSFPRSHGAEPCRFP